MVDDNNLSGSDSVAAESRRVQLVPPPPEKSDAEKAWEEKLIHEAQGRIFRRTLLFWSVSATTLTLFLAFLSYIALIQVCPIFWKDYCSAREVDHLLLWLLGALPVGLVFVLIKLTSDPKKDEPITTWPDELVKLGNVFVNSVADIAKEVVKKKIG